MPPQFVESGQPVQHSLEQEFNASGWDILCAIQKGFRAKVDVKGKLAEWFLYKVLEIEKSSGNLVTVEWHDEDGKPDFRLAGDGFDLTMECKNVSSGKRYADGSFKLETQKTRNQKDPKDPAAVKGTRWYKVSEFDIVAACLFNASNRWEYRFIRTADLERHDKDKKCLKTMQKVPPVVADPWKATLAELIAQFKPEKK